MLYTADSSAQNLFIAEWASDSIVEITSSGAQKTFASGLNDPQGLAFDSAGDLFVTEWGGNRIVEIAPGGMQSTFASGLNGPNGLAFDSAGDLFEADGGSGRIYEFISTNGTLTSTPRLFVSGLNNPQGLAFDRSGNLFEADGGSGNVYKFVNTNGVLAPNPILFASGLVNPWGLAFTGAGDLLVADCLYSYNGYITEITPNGAQSTWAPGIGSPNEMAFDGSGNLFVANGYTAGNSITEITPTGDRIIIGTNFYNPVGLAFQPPIHLSTTGIGIRKNQFTFTMAGQPGQVIVLEMCTNLAAPAWQPVQTNTLSGILNIGMSRFTDSLSTNYPKRFYRITSP